MAPIALHSSVDDDFVRTISDDDTVSSAAEEDDGLPDTKLGGKNDGRKRKRSESDQGHVASRESLKIKKRKKGEKDGRLSGHGISASVTETQENETEDGEDQDGGAMDSDFEFQVQNIDRDVIEELDAWGLPAGEERSNGSSVGNKPGLDLDELIARRRKLQKSEAESRDERVDNLEDSGGLDSDMDGSAPEDDKELNFEVEETLSEDAFGMGADTEAERPDEDEGNDDEDSETSSESEGGIADEMPEPDDIDAASHTEGAIDAAEQAKRDAFFAPDEIPPTMKTTKPSISNSFQPFSLSRPILRGLTTAGFSTPTPIQKRAIPVALLGKDVVGGAVTGSGKTAAFVIPILERLLYRPKKVPTTRVAILTPTRELAVQCFNVARKLASYTDITFCQLVGGFSLREQENVLRTRPDVIIATPGRFIDHMRNSPSFVVEILEILVLDEADRMLEDGFADELNQILTTIPESRQTMLFSATMTDSVDKLIRVGLKKPVRLLVDAQKQTVGTLVQEFVRLRPGREGLRLGHLVHLCQTMFTDHVIVFFRQKKEAHRVRILLGLLGIKAAELHGSMSQDQRISAITSFTSHSATHLLATDLASRGLDIPNVSTVINYSAPQTHEIYLHRVGRTARAGKVGRSCTLAAEEDRKVVKAAVKAGRAQGAKIVSRVVEPQLAESCQAQVEALQNEVEEILREEKEEKLLAQGEMHVRKGENLIEHQAEIKARAKRTWFESEKEKLRAKKAGFVELNGHGAAGGKKKGKGAGGKLSGKEKKALDDRRERVEGRLWKKGKEVEKKGGAGKGKAKGKGGRDKKRVNR